MTPTPLIRPHCSLDRTSLFLNFYLSINCCFLWTVPSFPSFCVSHTRFRSELLSPLDCTPLSSNSHSHQGRLVLTVHWTFPPSVSSTCALFDLSLPVHRTVPPMFGFHHMYFVLSSTVHRTVPPVFEFQILYFVLSRCSVLAVHRTVPPWYESSPSGSSMLTFLLKYDS